MGVVWALSVFAFLLSFEGPPLVPCLILAVAPRCVFGRRSWATPCRQYCGRCAVGWEGTGRAMYLVVILRLVRDGRRGCVCEPKDPKRRLHCGYRFPITLPIELYTFGLGRGWGLLRVGFPLVVRRSIASALV